MLLSLPHLEYGLNFIIFFRQTEIVGVNHGLKQRLKLKQGCFDLFGWVA